MCVAITLGTLPLGNPLLRDRIAVFLGSLSNVVAGNAFEVTRSYPCAPRYGCSPLSVSTLYL